MYEVQDYKDNNFGFCDELVGPSGSVISSMSCLIASVSITNKKTVKILNFNVVCQLYK